MRKVNKPRDWESVLVAIFAVGVLAVWALLVLGIGPFLLDPEIQSVFGRFGF